MKKTIDLLVFGFFFSLFLYPVLAYNNENIDKIKSQISPENDHFVNASRLNGHSGFVTAYNYNAGIEDGELNNTNNWYDPRNSVWWKWIPPDSGHYVFHTRGSDFNTVLAVYSGSELSNLSLIAINNDISQDNDKSLVFFYADALVQYHIVIDGWFNNPTGEIELTWEKQNLELIFGDDFEHDLSNWHITQNEGTINAWALGDAITKTGHQSVYISSDSGATANYDISDACDTNIERSLDLTSVINPYMKFYWKHKTSEELDSIPPGFGEFYVKNETNELFNKTLWNADTWQMEMIDLSFAEGTPVTVGFNWKNRYSKYQTKDDTGLCLDDIVITGEYSSLPIFISTPKKIAQINKEYIYPVLLNISDATAIKALSLPHWLTTVENSDVFTLKGTPGNHDMNITNTVIIEAQNENGSNTQEFDILVSHYYENFEEDISEWRMYEDLATDVDAWVIDDRVAHNGRKSAYVSYDKQGEPYLYGSSQSRSWLVVPVNLTNIYHPKLGFWWKRQSSSGHGYGEVFVELINGTFKRISIEKELRSSPIWTEKQIDISEFQGKIIQLLFYWTNDGLSGRGPVDGSLCIDDIQITGRYSDQIINKNPQFSSDPKTTDLSIELYESYHYTITTIDYDSDSLTISVASCPEWLTLQQTDQNGMAILSGQADEVGWHTITINATDGMFNSLQTFQIFVYERPFYKFKRMLPALLQPWYFTGPEGIAAYKDEIYIVDTYSNKIYKYNKDGRLITQWGKYGSGEGEFNRPFGIAVGPEGKYVYVTDQLNYRVQKFDSDGNFILKWGGRREYEELFMEPASIAVDTDGNVYVADSYWSKIMKFNSFGEPKEFDSAKEGQYTISDLSGHNEEGECYSISGLAVDSDGNIYISDSAPEPLTHISHRVQKFNNKGEFLNTWGSFGSLHGQFNMPKGIAIDAKNTIYIVDKNNRRVQTFDSDGNFITQWSTKTESFEYKLPSGPNNIAISVDDNGEALLFITDGGKQELATKSIKIFTTDGENLDKWKNYGDRKNEFFLPLGIAVDSEDNVYVCDSRNNRIKKYFLKSEDGKKSGLIAIWGKDGENDMEFKIPYGISINSLDQIFVTDTGNHRVQVFNKDGNYISQFGSKGDGKGEFQYPLAITIDIHDNIYVADNNCIQKFDKNFNFIKIVGSKGNNSDQYSYSTDITTDKDLNIYITDGVTNRIQKFDKNNNFVMTIGGYGRDNGQLDFPCGILYDHKSDILFVTERGNSRIQAFNTQGEYLFKFGEYGVFPGQLYYPAFLAMDSQGDIYLTDAETNRFQTFSKISLLSGVSKAIIVSGRKGSDDDLLSAFQACTNFSYFTLYQQGFTKETIKYLSHNNLTYKDLGGESIEHVDITPTADNFKDAIETWALEEPKANNLIIYLSDHGEENLLFLDGEDESFSSKDLYESIEKIKQQINGQIIVIYDACYSGSFLSEFSQIKDDKIIFIASSQGKETSKYGLGGGISFSNFFWGKVLNGENIINSYLYTKSAMKQFQKPQIMINGVNYSEAEEYTLKQLPSYSVAIGSGTQMWIQSPVIDSSDISLSINDSALELTCTVTDNIAVHNVKASIISGTMSYSTIAIDDNWIALPKTGQNMYHGAFDNINPEKTYTVSIIAEDNERNLSKPEIFFVKTGEVLKSYAIIIASDDEKYSSSLEWCYKALKKQMFSDDHISLFSTINIPGAENITPRLPEIHNIIDSFEQASKEANEVLIYMVGSGFGKNLHLQGNRCLTSSNLSNCLDYGFSSETPFKGQIVLVYDACNSGTFVKDLIKDDLNLIVITSTEMSGGPVLLNYDTSFSRFFWQSISKGEKLVHAFNSARTAVQNVHLKYQPCIDLFNKGKCNTTKEIEENNYFIGMGIQEMGSSPLIYTISHDQKLVEETQATFRVSNIKSDTPIDKVVALIVPPFHTIPELSDVCQYDYPVIPLSKTNSSYETEYSFTISGPYHVLVYAFNNDGYISPAKVTRITKYEDVESDDRIENANVIVINDNPQYRTLTGKDDLDWYKLPVLENNMIQLSIQTDDNLEVETIVRYPDGSSYTPTDSEFSISGEEGEGKIFYLCIKQNSNPLTTTSYPGYYTICAKDRDADTTGNLYLKGFVYDADPLNQIPLSNVLIKSPTNDVAGVTDGKGFYKIKIFKESSDTELFTFKAICKCLRNTPCICEKYKESYRYDVNIEDYVDQDLNFLMISNKYKGKIKGQCSSAIVEGHSIDMSIQIEPSANEDITIYVKNHNNLLKVGSLDVPKENTETVVLPIEAKENIVNFIERLEIIVATDPKTYLPFSKSINIIDKNCDVDNNGTLDLKDVILSLEHTTSIDTDVYFNYDINGNTKIDISESIYVMKCFEALMSKGE